MEETSVELSLAIGLVTLPYGEYVFPLAVLAIFCFLTAVFIAVETRKRTRIVLKPVPPPMSIFNTNQEETGPIH